MRLPLLALAVDFRERELFGNLTHDNWLGEARLEHRAKNCCVLESDLEDRGAKLGDVDDIVNLHVPELFKSFVRQPQQHAGQWVCIGLAGADKQEFQNGFVLVGQPWRLAFGLQGMTVLPSLTLIEWADGLQHARVAQDWTLVQAIERRIRAEALTDSIGKAWYLRQDIIWRKLSPMPESVRDRCTKAHEYIFLLAKSESYHFDANAISEPAKAGRTPGNKNAPKGQAAYEAGVEEHRTKAGLLTYSQKVQGSAGIQRSNKRSVWDIASEPYAGAHYAPFPRKLVEPCILAGCPAGGVVLDPFFGSGTTGEVAQNLGCHFIGIDLDRRNDPLQAMRLQQPGLILETV
jgi:hypothetical protein